MRFKLTQQLFTQLTNAGFVFRVADVDDLTVTLAITVFDDARQRLDAIGHVSEAAFLLTAIHQTNRRALHQVQDQLGNGARAAHPCRVQTVKARAHPVERAEQRELEAFLAIGPDHAVEQLLDTE